MPHKLGGVIQHNPAPAETQRTSLAHEKHACLVAVTCRIFWKTDVLLINFWVVAIITVNGFCGLHGGIEQADVGSLKPEKHFFDGQLPLQRLRFGA